MGTFPLSIVPGSFLGREAQCAWASEPVFTLEESARLLGIKKRTLVETVRKRFPEIKLPPKVLVSLTSTFGPSLTFYGEVYLILDTMGGPQEHICLTHYGLFRHTVYIRTPQARQYVLRYPEFINALASGAFRAPIKIAQVYRSVIESSPGRDRAAKIREACAELRKSENTIRRHIKRIVCGQATCEGLPVIHRPGPCKGYRAKINLWMGKFLKELCESGHSKKECCQGLNRKLVEGEDPLTSVSYTTVSRFLRCSGRGLL